MTELPPDERQIPLRETGVQRGAEAPEPRTDELQTPWRGDWGHELSPVPGPEAPVQRERIFSPKTIIGWAVLTLVLYFGVHMVSRAIKEGVRQSVRATTTAGRAPGSREGRVVILLPNGKRITIDKTGAEVSLPESPPAPSASKAGAAPSAGSALPAPKAPDPPGTSQKR